MKLIAAIDNHWNIGKDGGRLVHIPQDMKFFREKTMGKVVVMGRKTLESFPGKKPLKGRTNIVLTTDPEYTAAGDVIIVHSLEELAGVLSGYDENDIFVIGGGSIYRQLLPMCQTAYITKVNVCCEADTSLCGLTVTGVKIWEMQKGMWVEVEGTLKTMPVEGGGKTLVLYAERIQHYDPPADQFVYFS